MLVLTLRTDKPEAEIGLYDDDKQLTYTKWQAHRELSDTIHIRIKDTLDDTNKEWAAIEGIIYYAGPGSFTGLRIGAAVANALRSSLDVKLVSQSGDDWLQAGLSRLASGGSEAAIPHYGSEARTTMQKK